MKVLVLSCKTGMGHHQTGMAIIDYLHSKGVEAEMLDVFEYITPLLSESLSKGYLLSTKLTPKAYAGVYRMLEKRNPSDEGVVQDFTSRILSSKLMKFLTNYAPDAIISTHIYAGLLVSFLRRKKGLACPLIGIVTDYTIHPYWEDSNLDYYVTASELLNLQLIKKGIDPAKALPIGIPINPKFAGEKVERSEARRMLELQDKPTVLVMMGSMGYGNVIKQLKKIDNMQLDSHSGTNSDFQVVCVCGNNKKLFSSINKHTWRKNIIALGYVNNVELLMDAADVLITKPGGLTTSEFLAKQVPAVLVNPIPGHEDRNAEFLCNNGLAVRATKTYPVDEALFQLLSFDWRRDSLSNAAAKMGKPNAVQDLCDFIIDDLGEMNA